MLTVPHRNPACTVGSPLPIEVLYYGPTCGCTNASRYLLRLTAATGGCANRPRPRPRTRTKLEYAPWFTSKWDEAKLLLILQFVFRAAFFLPHCFNIAQMQKQMNPVQEANPYTDSSPHRSAVQAAFFPPSSPPFSKAPCPQSSEASVGLGQAVGYQDPYVVVAPEPTAGVSHLPRLLLHMIRGYFCLVWRAVIV